MGRFSATQASPLAVDRRWVRKARDRSLPPEPPREDRRHLLARFSSANDRTQDEIWQSLSWEHQGSVIFEAAMYEQCSASKRQSHCERVGFDLSFLLDVAEAQQAAQAGHTGHTARRQDRAAMTRRTHERARQERIRVAQMAWELVMTRFWEAQQEQERERAQEQERALLESRRKQQRLEQEAQRVRERLTARLQAEKLEAEQGRDQGQVNCKAGPAPAAKGCVAADQTPALLTGAFGCSKLRGLLRRDRKHRKANTGQATQGSTPQGSPPPGRTQGSTPQGST
jgi:hypothetical protein